MVRESRCHTGFLLRLPASIKEQAVALAHEDGTSLNHFISLAVAEKITRLEPEHIAMHARRDGPPPRPMFVPHAGFEHKMRKLS